MREVRKILYLGNSTEPYQTLSQIFINFKIEFEIEKASNRNEFIEKSAEGNYCLVFIDSGILKTDKIDIIPFIEKTDKTRPIVLLTDGEPVNESLFEINKNYSKIFIIDSNDFQKSLDLMISFFIEQKPIRNFEKTQGELEISLQKYKVLFESFPFGITITDSSGKILESNYISEALLGLNKNEQSKRTYDSKEWKIIRVDGTPMPPEEFASVRAMKENRIVRNIEMGIVKENDVVTWINVTAAPIPLQKYGVAIIYNDITDKKNAEEKLSLNEERLRYALDATSDALWDWDIEKQSIYFSPRFYTMLKYEPYEFILDLEKFKSLIHPDDVDRVISMIMEYIEAARDHHRIEFRMMSKEQSWRWILSRGKIVERDASGKPKRLVGTHNDFSERKRIEEDLWRKNRSLRIMSECNSVLIKAKREDELGNEVCKIISQIGNYPLVWIGLSQKDFNRSITPIASFGREIDDLVSLGFTWSDDEKGQSPIGKAIKRSSYSLVRNIKSDKDYIIWIGDALNNGYKSILSIPLIVNNSTIGGLVIYSSEYNDFDDDEINLLSELADDISYGIQSLRAHQEQEKLREQLFQSQKSEAIGRLAGGIAHDFNNILTIIQGNADLLSYHSVNNPLFNNFLSQIKNAADKAASLTHQLLAFSRKEIVQPKVLNLNKLIRDMEKMVFRLIGEDIKLKVELDQGLLNIKADQSNIDQILMNLIVNARDAMPNGGVLQLKTSNVDISKDEVLLNRNFVEGKFVNLIVKDNGFGIPSEIIDKIFDPFFTTKQRGKGTGLGLSVVEGIVTQNKGFIQVESEVGVGTKFSIYLPATDSRLTNESYNDQESILLSGKGKKILVIEDESIIRDLVKNILQMREFTIFEAATIAEAFTLLEQEKGQFNLIFSDIVLPDGSGIDFFEAAILRYPKLKVIFTSGYADERAKWSKIQDRQYPFIAKPFKIKDILLEIKNQMV